MAKKYQMALFLVLALMLFRQTSAQSNCSNTLMSLSSCINFVTGNSSTPTSSCCTSLANVVQSQPRCLCPLLNNGAGFSLGIVINQTLAVALPGACNIRIPPISQCNAAANGPAPAPLSPPADAAIEPSENPPAKTPEIPSGTGSKTVPTTSGGTSDRTLSIYLIAVTLLIPVWMANILHFSSFH